MRTAYIKGIPEEEQEYEVTFQCPVCLAMETLVIENRALTDSKYWKQNGSGVYHRECGRPAVVISMGRRNVWLPSPTANFLIRVLESKYITVSSIATNIGVSRTTVKRWLLDKCRPNKTSRRKLMRYSQKL